MEYKIKTRDNQEYIIKEDKINIFLYNTILGRIILKIIISPFISKIVGVFQNSRVSTIFIKKFIKKNNINIEEYQNKKYTSFNDFFTRKIKKAKRHIDKRPEVLISPCDGKLMVYKLNEENTFKVKQSYYQINELIGQDTTGYENGYALIFRLCVDDYHRYIFVDEGTREKTTTIKGKLHTVRPIAINKYKVFSQNERTITKLHTTNFKDIIQIEVGALMVGKIINNNKIKFKRGEEKGYFKFGASTIILLINNIKIDEDILKNSKNNIETIVKLGEKIGIKN